MALLYRKRASGVTATAMKTDIGGTLEEKLYSHMHFNVLNLFPQIEFPKAIDFSDKSYEELREKFLEDPYEGFAVLMIGKYEEILKLTEGDIENFIQVDKDEGRVISMLDQREIYYLKNLALARSIDFRPDRANVKGILLVICSPAPVWRNYQQWLGRVGRHGDQCE